VKIKSITPTNKFAEIAFSEVIEDPTGKRVYTPSGFQPILACEKIKTGPTVRVSTPAGEIKCDPHHRFMVHDSQPRFAKDLTPADRLVGYGGRLLTQTVSSGPIAELYDIQLPSPHWWYTSGVVSHNSILLCNNAITSLRGRNRDGSIGQDVLLISFEMDTIKTGLRCVANAAGCPIADIPNRQDFVRNAMHQLQQAYKRRIRIMEMQGSSCSVNNIYAVIERLKRVEGWHPDVLILDYMDLMLSKNPALNKDSYTQQKAVAHEIRDLAAKENLLLFTATQTNRSGAGGNDLIDLSHAADSFGKNFSLDYVISLNQSERERAMKPAQIRFSVIKNRQGPKGDLITCEINYDTMMVKELL